MIWLNGDFNIIIRKGKFFLQHKDGRAHGLILKGTEAYRKLKRIIGRWTRNYRKHGAFNHGVAEWRFAVCRALYQFTEVRRNKLLNELDTKKFYEIHT